VALWEFYFFGAHQLIKSMNINPPWFVPLLISLCKKWQKTHVRKNILATNEVRQCGPRGARFYFFGGGWGWRIFLAHNVFSQSSHCVAIMLPMGSQHVPQVPNVFTLPHIIWPQFYSCNLYKVAKRRRLQQLYFGSVQSLILNFVMASQKKKRLNFGGGPHN
jgi:hypothetical protein